MTKINKIENIYPEIDELIMMLAQKNEQRISDILHHRMYKVSWTSQSELFEELQSVLGKFLQKSGSNLDKQIADRIKDILNLLSE